MTNAQLLLSIQADSGVATALVRDLIQKAVLTGHEALDAGDIALLRAANGRLQGAAAQMVELCRRIPVTIPNHESDRSSEPI